MATDMTPVSRIGSSGHRLDRVLALVVGLALLAPLLGYAWVLIDAYRADREQSALNRNLSTAQLAAAAADHEFLRIRSTLEYAARTWPQQGRTPQDSSTAGETVARVFDSAPGLLFTAAYDRSGRRLAHWGRRPDVSQAPVMRRLVRRTLSHGIPFLTETLHLASGDVVVSLVPAPPRRGAAACLAAGLPASRIEEWLQQTLLGGGVIYMSDAHGHVIAASGTLRNRRLPLGQYLPMRFALGGQQGALIAPSPDGIEDTLIGFAHAPAPGFGVLSTQPLEAAFEPTNLFILRMAVLLVPILMLLFSAVWYRLRYLRQMEAFAHQLAAQNEGLRAADRAKSEFLANVSHDLRTPLASLKLSVSELLDREHPTTDQETRATLAIMGDEVDQLAGRVDNLLEMSRLEAGTSAVTREPADLTDLVGAALERLEPLTRGRPLEASFPDEPLMVECDQGQIERLLVNLLENAVKYSPAGSPLHLKGVRENGAVVFAVRDEGQGIAPGEEDRLFDKFYRSSRNTSVRGTGLGLAICKAIVEAHQGEIGVHSEPGLPGSEFWFRLPAMPGMREDSHA